MTCHMSFSVPIEWWLQQKTVTEFEKSFVYIESGNVENRFFRRKFWMMMWSIII